jgi:hypothetical protein
MQQGQVASRQPLANTWPEPIPDDIPLPARATIAIASERAKLLKKGGCVMDHWKSVEIERDGKRYTGKYRVDGGIITVTYDGDGGAAKPARVGNIEPERLAKLILTELVTGSPHR